MYKRMNATIPEPRNLTDLEIQELVNAIPNVRAADKQIAQSHSQSIRRTVALQLKQILLCPLGIQRYKHEMVKQFERSQIHPGTPVGVIAAGALGAPITQMALNTFHSAGSAKNVSAGVERIKELINITMNLKHPSSSIHFKDRNVTFEQILTDMRKSLVEICVDDLKESYDTANQYEMFGPEGAPLWYNLFKMMIRSDFDESQYLLRIKLNTKMMYTYSITMEDLADTIEKAGGVICVYSPLDIGIMDVYPIPQMISATVDTSNSIINESNKSLIFLETIVKPKFVDLQISGISGIRGLYPVIQPTLSVIESEIKGEGGMWFLQYAPARMRSSGIGKENVKRLVEASGMSINVIDSPEWEEEYLCVTVPESMRAITEELPDGKSPMAIMREAIALDEKNETRWEEQEKKNGNKFPVRPASAIANAAKYIYADSRGSNLKLLLGRDEVDPRFTYSNNPHEILASFGIEAARNFLYLDFIRVITAEGSYINPRHIALLVDLMTNPGDLVPITFSGIQRDNRGTLPDASFQQSSKIFKRDALVGRSGPARQTSAAVFLGGRSLIGTSSVELHIDPEYAAQLKMALATNKSKISREDLLKGISEMAGSEIGGSFIESNNKDLDNAILEQANIDKYNQAQVLSLQETDTIGTAPPQMFPPAVMSNTGAEAVMNISAAPCVARQVAGGMVNNGNPMFVRPQVGPLAVQSTTNTLGVRSATSGTSLPRPVTTGLQSTSSLPRPTTGGVLPRPTTTGVLPRPTTTGTSLPRPTTGGILPRPTTTGVLPRSAIPAPIQQTGQLRPGISNPLTRGVIPPRQK